MIWGLQARGAEHPEVGAAPCSWEQLLQPLRFNRCFINFSLDCTTAIVDTVIFLSSFFGVWEFLILVACAERLGLTQSFALLVFFNNRLFGYIPGCLVCVVQWTGCSFVLWFKLIFIIWAFVSMIGITHFSILFLRSHSLLVLNYKDS